MKTYKITKADLDQDNYYTGSHTEFDGHLEIAPNLGNVKFKTNVSATGNITALNGSGIKADYGISAGGGISVGFGISAGWGISANDGITARLGIKTGYGISAGSGIKAGGVMTDYGITCKELNVQKFIFAGTISYREPTLEETQITCTKLVSGTIKHGVLNLV